MNNKYHLVLEKRPGDFMPIDINLLKNDNNNYHTLPMIDNFTKEYNQEELLSLIVENNIIPSSYLSGDIKIINDMKYRFPVLYKDNNFAIDKYINENINNKTLMNKLMNIYLKYSDNKDEIKDAISKKDVGKILSLISSLDYENIRNIYFYLFMEVELNLI